MRKLLGAVAISALLASDMYGVCKYDRRFDLEDLPAQRTRTRSVSVELYTDPNTEHGALFERYSKRVISDTKALYKRDLDIDLRIHESAWYRRGLPIHVFSQEAYERFRKQYAYRSESSKLDFGIAVPYRRVSAIMPMNMASFAKEEEYFVAVLTNTLAHEIAHLLGEWHSGDTPYDLIQAETDGSYNVMLDFEDKVSLSSPRHFHESQKRRIHNRLAGGKALRAWRKAGDLETFRKRVIEAIENRACSEK